MNQWINFGDTSFSDYGGTQVRKIGENTYEYFHLKVSAEGYKYAFSGIIEPDFSDYADILEKSAAELGYSNLEEFKNYELFPERAVAEIIENFGCGPFEFSPQNYKGTGQYSLSYDDFLINDNELYTVLKTKEII